MSDATGTFNVNEQARLSLTPTDSGGNPVMLDPGALTITKTSGDGAFGYNAATNGAVFFSDLPGTSVFDIQVDGQPGPGESFLPVTVTINVTPMGAVSVGASVTVEPKGTPA